MKKKLIKKIHYHSNIPEAEVLTNIKIKNLEDMIMQLILLLVLRIF